MAACSECFADATVEELHEIIVILVEYCRLSLLPIDIIKDILGEKFNKIEKYLYRAEDY